MKNLIIGGIANCDWTYAHRWVESILKFKDDNIDIALVYGNPDGKSVEYLSKKGVLLHCYEQDKRIAPHVQRFIYIWDFLKKNDGKYDKVLTTDVRDVVFQSNPFMHDRVANGHAANYLTFSSEEMLYNDEPWGRQNLLETFGSTLANDWMHWEIYNVGVIAGSAPTIQDLMLQIFLTCQGRPIPICDQAIFNYLIYQRTFAGGIKLRHVDNWCVQAGTVADPTKIEQFRPKLLDDLEFEIRDDQIWRKGADVPYAIVHQYDRVPEWKKLFEEKYSL